jgi:hypothetical protein
MTTNDSSPDHGPLRQVLRQWSVQIPLPAQFRAGVWERIACAKARPPVTLWSGLWSWLSTELVRPGWAVSYIAILLGLGMVAGYWHGTEKQARNQETLRTLYVQAVDPYYAAHH